MAKRYARCIENGKIYEVHRVIHHLGQDTLFYVVNDLEEFIFFWRINEFIERIKRW